MEHSEKPCKLSIVVPVYRSAPILPELVRQVHSAMAAEGWAEQFELILVNDCSPDDSWQVIRALGAQHSFVRGITLRRNAGQHNAVMAGLHHVRGRFVAVMDDDLQHPPASLGDLVRALEAGYDVCYTRYVNRQHALWKQLGSRFNDYAATLLLSKPKNLYLSSFKAMRREIAEEVIKYDGPYSYVDGLILEVTQSITSIDITHQARLDGESNYNFRRLVSLWMKMATSFSVFPLRVAIFLGFSLSALSLLLGLLIIVMRLTQTNFPQGWASLIATVLLIGGVETMCIGMVGEYLGRAYLKLNNKPQFVIGQTTWSAEEQA